MKNKMALGAQNDQFAWFLIAKMFIRLVMHLKPVAPAAQFTTMASANSFALAYVVPSVGAIIILMDSDLRPFAA
jgi:hypothetical protein